MHFNLNPKKAIFLHIPKTAGTTLNHILCKNYSKAGQARIYTQNDLQLAVKAELEAQKANYIYGHFHYIPEFSATDYYLTTCIREPVARTVSQFLHMKYSSHPVHVRRMKLVNTFDDFLKNEQPWDLQAKRLSGVTLRREVNNNDEINALALEHFHHFDFVGITERFEESLLCLSTDLKINRLHYKKQNVQQRRDEFEEVLKTNYDRIVEHNQFDLKLYEMANAKLDEHLKKITPFQKALYALRKKV